MRNEFKQFKPLNAVTATTTSDPIDIMGAKKVSLEFKRSNHSSGSSAFKVQVRVTKDGSWIDYNKLIDNVTNSNAQTLTRVLTATLSSDTSKFYTMDLQHDTFYEMRVVVTETTDGTHDAWAVVEYEN